MMEQTPTSLLHPPVAVFRGGDAALLSHHNPTHRSFQQNGVRPQPSLTRTGQPPWEAQEPPRKRSRLSQQIWTSEEDLPTWVRDQLAECLVKQVFPHVDAELERLPTHLLIDKSKLATATISALTAEEFTTEFRSREGELSPAFECQLRSRAKELIWRWSTQPRFQRRQESTSTSKSPEPAERRPSFQPPVHTSAPTNTPHSAIIVNDIPHIKSADSGISPSSKSAIPTPTFPAIAQDALPEQSKTFSSKFSCSDSEWENLCENGAASPAPSSRQPEHLQMSQQSSRSLSHDGLQSRADAFIWQDDGRSEKSPSAETGRPQPSSWFSLARLPYGPRSQKQRFLHGIQDSVRLDSSEVSYPVVFHVDFSPREIQDLCVLVRRLQGVPSNIAKANSAKELRKMIKKHFPVLLPKILAEVDRSNAIRRRTRADVQAFLIDLTKDLPREAAVLSLAKDEHQRQASYLRSAKIDNLLFAREVSGHRGYGHMRRLMNFTNEFKNCREDGLELRSEWTDCAGDITTITWISNDAFICGTTEHSDSHNQQYNKPGNLVLGSCSKGTLRAYPDHRVVRPIVETGENSTDAMRESQSPWLYSSVVSSDCDRNSKRAFTSAFDHTVKVWNAENNGSSMSLLGTWRHDGNVNFVIASKHESGMVATAADVSAAAVRVYNVDKNDVSNSPFHSFSCSRVLDLEGNEVSTEKWAYFPATMNWGISHGVQHLLLVGYSPRSKTADDNDIPEDRRNSGEICLWDGVTGERWRITSGTSQNVFEVLWHPTQPSFIAATSPHGLDLEDGTRTQIRVYRLSDSPEFGGKAFSAVHTCDCVAADINELSIMANSFSYCYIAAACTDGNAYVWDTANGDKPIHVLRHGKPVEELSGDLEKEDTGVKFVAWGNTADRLYTGSSDGVVKIWNVRCSRRNPLVRDILNAPAQVSYGRFSPDRTKLVIGDASGRVFLLSIDEQDQMPGAVGKLQLPKNSGAGRLRRPPKMLIHHPEPDPPAFDANGNPIEDIPGTVLAAEYVEKKQIRIHPHRAIGAVQGENYAETGLFCRDAHGNGDPAEPLLAKEACKQQDQLRMYEPSQKRIFRAARDLKECDEADESQHAKSVLLDQALADLSKETKLALQMERVELDDVDYLFDYEDSISDDIFDPLLVKEELEPALSDEELDEELDKMLISVIDLCSKGSEVNSAVDKMSIDHTDFRLKDLEAEDDKLIITSSRKLETEVIDLTLNDSQ